MRPNKGMFKVFSLVTVLAMLLISLPASSSRTPIRLNKIGDDVVKIVSDMGHIFSKIHINFASGNTSPPTVVTTEVAQKVTAEADPDKDNQITSPSGKITLIIPKGAVPTISAIELDEYSPKISTGMVMLSLFDLTAKDEASGTAFSKFNQNLQISIQNDPTNLTGVDPNSIQLYYQDETTQQWVPVANSKFDPKTNILTGVTDHFTLYGEMANPLINGPGKVLASNVNMHSGASIFSYPLELPSGPGGFQPKLQLNYDSGTIDEMKNKRDMGSWVGIGWTLDLGSISLDLNSGQYYLELNGASYPIVSSDGTNYYTVPDQHYKITRSGNTWNVYDKDGYYYRFGGTSDSQQYVEGIYYRWDLSLMQDTNNNQAAVSYTQEILGTSVRSAYPATLTYGSIQVSFAIGYDVNDPTDGYIRYDDPKTDGSNPAPTVMETRRLNSIAIKVSGTLIRQYNLAYNTTNSTVSSDYGGIYYSGQLTLTSITQVGADGTSTLPAMTFTYQGEQIYVKNSVAVTYTGNPGNPASLSWPYLIVINSGYGASTTYAYTQIPNTSAIDIWTREAVTTRTNTPGIGPTETYTYSYTGNPQYFINNGDVWDAQYRGFSQVRETDSAGNYVDHYFNTVDPSDGDAEKLTGQETGTESYSSNGTLLQNIQNQWGWDYTSQTYNFMRTFGGWAPIGWFRQPDCVAVSSNGYVYIADFMDNRIEKFDSSGNFITNWGSLGNGIGQFCDPEGVAVDSSGNVYVVDSGNYRIEKFTSTGTFLTTWGTSGSGNGQFYGMWGIAIDSSGYVYVSDFVNNRIQKFDSNGSFVTSWGSSGSGNGQFNYPYGVAVDSSGYVYVVDQLNARVQKFTSTGTFVTTWGSPGSGNGQFSSPYGIAVDSSGYVYVTDASRVQKFTSTGTFVTTWGSSGKGNGQFYWPKGIAVDNNGYVYVVNSGLGRVQKFTSTGTFIVTWGNALGVGNGQLNAPYGVAVSSDGYIYVVDALNRDVQKFTSTGTFVTQWGSYGSGNGQFVTPMGVAVDNSGYVYVLDYATATIQKFDSNGNFVTKFGSGGSGNGQFRNPYFIAAGSDGYIYVSDTGNNRIQKLTNTGTFVTAWGSSGTGNGQFQNPFGITVSNDGYVYVVDDGNNRIQKFTNTGTFVTAWGSLGTGNGQFQYPNGIAVGSDGYVYVVDWENNRIQKFDSSGNFVTLWYSSGGDWGIAVDSQGYVYLSDYMNSRILKFERTYSIKLNQVDTITGSKTAQTRYLYDSYGNVITTYNDGDTSTNTDDSTIWNVYNPNTTANILDKPTRERTYTTIMTTDSGGVNLKQETDYNYDNQTNGTPPNKGNLTSQVQWINATNSVTTNYTYDTYGNKLTEKDPNGNTTTWTYDTTYHTYPTTKTDPITSLTESYTYDPGTNNILTTTDVNGQVTINYYDTFKRLTSVVKPGDTQGSPSITYQYNNWGTLGSQNVKTITKINATNSIWSADYFDGLGRVVQTQNQSETSGHTFISSTTVYNNCGQVSQQYVSQDISSVLSAYYNTGISGWQSTSYTYDGLGRVLTQTNPDGTSTSNNYAQPWQTVVTNARGFQDTYSYDAFNRLVQVQNYAPPTVVTNAASSITSSSATLNGNLAGLGSAGSVTVSFQWGTTTSYGNTTTGQPMTAVGAFNAAISGLSANTTYHFRAMAVGDGTVYGNDFTLTTPTVAPSVSSSVATGIDPTTTMLNGNLASLGDATSVTVSFQWGLTTNYGHNTTGQVMTSPANFYAAISGLTAANTYHFRAKAVGSSTVYGADQQFTTQSSGGGTVIITSVITGTDDGFCGSGTFDNTDDWYEIGHPDSSDTYNAWFRFTGITIPAGATIDNAYLNVVEGEFDSGTSLKISAEKAANPNAPTSQADETSRVRTTSNVAWTSGYNDYEYHSSPSFTSVIQELVNNYTYSNSAIQILVDNNGSTTGTEAEGSTYEDTGYPPQLYIQYHMGSGDSSPPAVGTNAVSNVATTSATLNGNLTSLGSTSSVQVSFQWGMDTNYGNTTASQPETSTGTFTASLTGLNPNTVYHVRAVAVGATTTYGSDMLLSTTPSVTTAVTTTYAYDVLGNLIQVTDNNGNNTSMTYDWLSRKTNMTDPDMGAWSYGYDSNGNLTTQTDAKSQKITMVYDAMNRLTNKNYPSGSGMTNIVYTYDSTAGGNYGKGQRTGMTDASGTTSDTYDNRGRLVQEQKTINSVPYTTSYTYDGLDRIATITYPTGETVTNTYNGRGLPNAVSGSSVGNLVTNAVYNQLGDISEIDLNNGVKTTYGYYGTGGTYDTTGGYYGQLWQIKSATTVTTLLDVQYTWDADGNMTQRQNLVSSQTENFTYDSLDRLAAVSGAYSNSYSYNAIGDITSMNGLSYTYGTKPQAVTAVGSTNYVYDADGNMTTRGGQTITWDVENRPTAISGGASFVYNGDGNRVEQTQGGQTTIYINQYYEKNITTGVATTYYYLGRQLVAQNTGGTLRYIHQDSLGSTSVMTTSTGTLDSSIAFYPFGTTWTGSVNTTKEFTGQRLDSTGLYYYGARYYDATIGRFISSDTVVQDLKNPQTLNRYSYCVNNPLKYIDPSGRDEIITTGGVNDNGETWYTICDGQGNLLAIATGISDLAQKMQDCEAASEGVPLPHDQAVQDFLATISPKTNAPPPSFPTDSIHWPSTPLPQNNVLNPKSPSINSPSGNLAETIVGVGAMGVGLWAMGTGAVTIVGAVVLGITTAPTIAGVGAAVALGCVGVSQVLGGYGLFSVGATLYQRATGINLDFIPQLPDWPSPSDLSPF